MTGRHAPALDRWLDKVDRSGGPDACWPWTAGRFDTGYGTFHPGGGVPQTSAHRWAHEHFIGPIPAGYDVDHLCHNRTPDCKGGRACPHRKCANPAHLEAVPPSLNKSRSPNANSAKTHCPADHAYTPENTIVQAKGSRLCRTCQREKLAARRAARRLGTVG